MPLYRSEFAVAAPPERVWDVLTDFERYHEWNPQIPSITGRVELGENVRLKLQLPGRPAMNLVAQLSTVEPNRLLKWHGHVLAPWFFRGERIFSIEPSDAGKVIVTHAEDVRGLMSPVFALAMGGPQTASHKALNEALRERCETND